MDELLDSIEASGSLLATLETAWREAAPTLTTFSDDISRLLTEAESAPTEDERGKRFEALLQFLFESVPGTLVVPNTRNYFGAEQVDLAVSNAGGFPALPDKFLVECKNYSHKLESNAVVTSSSSA
ncbi:MAG TPA: hypothetical protein VFQ85_09370 [Mycobacteriales bacterium]|nr:hypothetical protein [Mycobacteriales bacterium]